MTDLGEMKKQTAQLRDEIRRLRSGKCQCDRGLQGDCWSVMTFLSGQHEDLVDGGRNAGARLLQELDEGMRAAVYRESLQRSRRSLTRSFKNFSAAERERWNWMEEAGYPGGRNSDHCAAAGKKAAEYDAAFRWREGADSHRTVVCDPESEAVAVLSSG